MAELTCGLYHTYLPSAEFLNERIKELKQQIVYANYINNQELEYELTNELSMVLGIKKYKAETLIIE